MMRRMTKPRRGDRIVKHLILCLLYVLSPFQGFYGVGHLNRGFSPPSVFLRTFGAYSPDTNEKNLTFGCCFFMEVKEVKEVSSLCSLGEVKGQQFFEPNLRQKEASKNFFNFFNFRNFSKITLQILRQKSSPLKDASWGDFQHNVLRWPTRRVALTNSPRRVCRSSISIWEEKCAFFCTKDFHSNTLLTSWRKKRFSNRLVFNGN